MYSGKIAVPPGGGGIVTSNYVNVQNMYSNNIMFFFSNSDRDFYSENNNISQVYTYRYYNKNTKKKMLEKRCYRLRVCAPFCAKHWRHLYAIPTLLFLISFSR
jgi:hypothetical protein